MVGDRRRARDSGAPRVGDVVGVAMLPPPAAMPLVERARQRVAMLHRRLVPPPVRVIEALLAGVDTAALGALCALDIPDQLAGRMSISALAARVDADVAVVERLVRYAAARGWLRLDRTGRVAATSTTRFLRRDHPGGWRAWVDFSTGPEVFAALGVLANEPRSPDPFAAANGAPFFAWQPQHAERHAAFDAAMAAGGRMHGLALAAALDWSTIRRVCDVGGGTGEALRVLLAKNRHLRGVLFDLPAVVARAAPAERLEAVGGDAFAAVAPGCDAYVLINVVHDWGDDDAVKMLARVAEARLAGGQVIVVEHLRRARPLDGIALRSDLLMLALTAGGRERNDAEVEALGTRAGLALQRTVALASGDTAYVFT